MTGKIGLLARRELRAHLVMPATYVGVAAFVLLNGISFCSYLANNDYSDTSIKGFCDSSQFLVLLLAALLTMRSLAEERSSGTWELLFTSPIRDFEVVLAKYLASLCVLTAALLLTTFFPVLLFTFGDPDFFNGIGHAIPVVEALHEEFPELTYDATIKVEHLLKYADHIDILVRTGCLFVTTAVESVDDRVLNILDKGHTRDDFVQVIELARRANLTISPTFIPFLPWSSREGYLELLQLLVHQGMVDYVAPVQLTIRLLIPEGSRLLAVEEMQKQLGKFDAAALSYQWSYPDPAMDALHDQVSKAAEAGEVEGVTRRQIFVELWRLAHEACGLTPPSLDLPVALDGSDHKPCLSEPWYCCAEPTAKQIAEF